uniref:DNA damage-binding protein 1 n=1 Tax=Octactis speculum TaxID=3111310 RepID=A0A7S2F9J7_9STRA
MTSILAVQTFSVIRSLKPFRLHGGTKDYLLVGCDSGKITILEYIPEENTLKQTHSECFGKTGCRRVVPGEYLAIDPKGRAIMISAVEKQKLVYVMNRDASNRLTISSPLEAHKAQTVVFATCGVDVDFENPIFACIELDYSEADQDATGDAAEETEKHLTYYELDLGLNHVIRKWSEPISRTASMLLTVPGGADGPSGVLVAGENWVAFKHQGHDEVRAPLPRRKDYPDERGLLVTAAATHKQRDLFFFLLQTEIGDLYKVTLDYEGDTVKDVVVTLFDTIHQSNSLCITRTGLLFAAAEFGDHALFQFQAIGDDDTAVTAHKVDDPELGDDGASAAKVAPRFTPGPPKNLLLIDEQESSAPILGSMVADLCTEGTPQVYCLCGRGGRSALRVLRHGVKVSEMAVSELPGYPSAVWTIKGRHDDPYDRYIVVSFTNATLVLSIGETVEEVTDSGFLARAPTLQVQLLADNAMLQVHPNGVRHIRSDGRSAEWKTPGKKSIEKGSANPRQLAISLAGGEVIYFELDVAGNLMEMGTKELGVDVACLDVGPLPDGRARSNFLAVGCYDNTVRLLALDSQNLLDQLASIQCPARPESLALVEMASDAASGIGGGSGMGLYLNVGLSNGILQRAAVDQTSGAISDTRTRFLGQRPVKLFRVTVQGQHGVLALSSRGWLAYVLPSTGRFYMTPLSYDVLEHAANFASEQCPEGMVAIASNTLRILTVERLGEVFNQTNIPLRYTPRKFVQVPSTNQLLIIESDHNEFSEKVRNRMAAESGGTTSGAKQNGKAGGMEVDDEEEESAVVIRGPVPAADGAWASCIRLVDPKTEETVELVELEDNEAALSICTCVFHARGGEAFVVIGTAKGMTLHPRQHQGCYIQVYRLLDNRLHFQHKTEVEDVPLALAEFQGRLLVGLGKTLRIYDLGKRKLLRKAENRTFPTMITGIRSMGDRIYVSDLMESVTFVKYRRHDNSLVVFADDQTPRLTTCFCFLDYDTVAGADKFGNVFVIRLPTSVSDDVDNPTGSRLLWDTGLLNGAPNKLDTLMQFHVGETVTSIHRCALVPGGAEAIVYVTVMGSLGALLPSQTREDKDFFTHLEMHMRQEFQPVTGRDHMSYRSYFAPVKEVADGELCELFTSLPYEQQQKVAADLDRSPGEVIKKLEDTRNRLL